MEISVGSFPVKGRMYGRIKLHCRRDLRRGICSVSVSDARKASYLLTSFLFLVSLSLSLVLSCVKRKMPTHFCQIVGGDANPLGSVNICRTYGTDCTWVWTVLSCQLQCAKIKTPTYSCQIVGHVYLLGSVDIYCMGQTAHGCGTGDIGDIGGVCSYGLSTHGHKYTKNYVRTCQTLVPLKVIVSTRCFQ